MEEKKTSWQDYEREKRQLQRENLPPEEYERRLQEIAERMGL